LSYVAFHGDSSALYEIITHFFTFFLKHMNFAWVIYSYK